MQDVAQKMAALEQAYVRYSEKVNDFFSAAAGTFPAVTFPSVRIVRRSTDPHADPKGDLFALGAHFELNFSFAVIDQPQTGVQASLGVLEVAVPATIHKPKHALAVWYFDQQGNVRTSATDPSSSVSIDDKSFVVEVVNKAEQEHFALLRP